ncbi:MAG: TraB/GumN family protein [Candidatus Delongbacteria bacterium]
MYIFKKGTVLLTVFLAAVILTADITEKKGNFLWQINDGRDSIAAYLLGSIHIVPDDIYPLSDRIIKAYQHSDHLAVEADINSPDAKKIGQLAMNRGLYTDGSSLTDELDKDTQTKLTHLLEYTGILGIEQAKMMKPWLLAMTLQQLLIVKKGYDPSNGIDMYFLRSAQRSEKNIFELESAEFQLDLISGFSDQIQIHVRS